jgi:MOSC domain-containing protein YiiM
MPRLLSVNVGLPRDIEWNGRTVHTGIWKEPVRGRCRVQLAFAPSPATDPTLTAQMSSTMLTIRAGANLLMVLKL